MNPTPHLQPSTRIAATLAPRRIVRARRWASGREAAVRLVSISLMFVTLYLACNELTHLRGALAGGVFSWERRIPFIPWTVVPYLSIFGFFAASFAIDRDPRRLDIYTAALVVNLILALACYACVPLQFTFEQPIPPGLFRPLFELLRAADLPYNRAPSLHISTLVLLWWRFRQVLPAAGRVIVGAWFLLIAGSVLTTYQHHLIDIPAGVAAACISWSLGRRLSTGNTWLGQLLRRRPVCAGPERRCRYATSASAAAAPRAGSST